MRTHIAIALLAATALAAGCAETGSMGGTTYGETAAPATTTSTNTTDRSGWIRSIEVVKVDDSYKFGIGTVVGAVAGGLLGSQVGGGDGRIVGGVVGAGVGAAAGTYAESKLRNKDAQRVTVQMATGGQLTILQPPDGRLQNGMNVWVQGSGDSARVVPR